VRGRAARQRLGRVHGATPLEIVLADDEQAAHLGVASATPLIHVHRTMTGSSDRPIVRHPDPSTQRR